MSQPVPVYIDLPGHDAIERELDEQLGLAPKPRPEKPWECLAGEAPATCQHNRLTKVHEDTRTLCRCACGHAWIEVS